jgi:hypothetical protein
LQWLQDPSEINGDNLKNIRHEASAHFRNTKREYMKDKINELTIATTRTFRVRYKGTNEFKRGYKLRSKLMRDESGHSLAYSLNILNKWEEYFSQLFKVQTSGVLGR